MSKPDSLLAAARRLAEGAGLSWAEVQPYYRALQEPGGSMQTPWLPKSAGRNVWAAHPHFIARLLFALGGARVPAEGHDAIELINSMTPNGREMWLTERPAAGISAPMENLFFRYLAEPELALELNNVEFRLDEGKVFLNTKTEGTVIYSRAAVSGEDPDPPARPYRGIYTRGVIDGAVFVYLARLVAWRLSSQPPFEHAKPGDELDD